MNLFRTLSGALLVGLTGAGLNSCINAPDYPIVPEIEFKDLQVGKYRPGGGQLAFDTLKFALNFKDGDGDLGLSDDDIKNAPFNAKTGGHNNRGYSFNYFIQPFVKNASGNFVQFVNAPPFGFVGEYDGRYLRLDGADAKPAPLRGVLRYKLPLALDGTAFSPGQVFRFEISIMDRALHESNKITTSEVKLGQ
ncbi:hypothetical protein Q3A66_19655 [Hymenobacter sp. BT770]|uniref:hypothetical protein n=1 Tax=Hymenobacter sp. BT770 TaxID=2886942 RepID=UPI001D0F6B54|nr:hypothetical protein [Hymenobacter sp. BT770]MCC3155292.1 hypothetical protein [Hymenobacter sp. BT770]MDO3417289.1 hypothetical protein [Hymenobacter sp. BT770]